MPRRLSLILAIVIVAAVTGWICFGLLLAWVFDSANWTAEGLQPPFGGFSFIPNIWVLGISLVVTVSWALVTASFMHLFGSSLANSIETFTGTRRKRCRVLFLRRFRKEQGGALRLSRAFDSLAARGHSVITLSDSVVWHNAGKSGTLYTICVFALFYPIAGVTLAVGFALPALAVGAPIFGLFVLVYDHLFVPNLPAAMLSQAVIMLIFGFTVLWLGGTSLIISRLTMPWASKFPDWLLTTLQKRLSNIWRPKWHGDAERAWRKAGTTGGLYSMATFDDQWVAAVSALVRTADVIAFDVGETSGNIEIEKALLAASDAGAKTMLFAPDLSGTIKNFEVGRSSESFPEGWESIGKLVVHYPVDMRTAVVSSTERAAEAVIKKWTENNPDQSPTGLSLDVQKNEDDPLRAINETFAQARAGLPFRFGETLDRLVRELPSTAR